MLPEREIHIVDSQGASMAEAILCFMGQELADRGLSAAEIADTLSDRASDLRMYVSLETLEYLKKGGRISGAQAVIGTLLSVKPIIAVEAGKVETADKPRTRSKSRERCIEMITARPIERLALLHTMAPDFDDFRAEVIRRSGLDGRRGHLLDRRPVGRAAPRAGLRRSSGPLQALRPGPCARGPRSISPRRDEGCDNVATTLRHGEWPGTGTVAPGYTHRRHLTRRPPDTRPAPRGVVRETTRCSGPIQTGSVSTEVRPTP